MSCTVVAGGQYGSEGKGKVVALTAARLDSPWLVRCGGPNSGHTVTIDGSPRVLRQVPSAPDHPDAVLLLSAGCAVDEDVLLEEVDSLNLPKGRVVVDPRAVLIESRDKEDEQESARRIASTASGTGAALLRRMGRTPDVRLAADSLKLRNRVRVEGVARLLHDQLDQGGDIVIEGTQGFGLSLFHGPHYPYLTSRDTTASGFCAEAGVSPRQVTDIVLVVRTFPIRVGGNSGPLAHEISWKEVAHRSGAPTTVEELTSVTRRVRRVGEFDLGLVLQACKYNRPTSLAVMGLDRLEYANCGLLDMSAMGPLARDFLARLEAATGVPVSWVGTGFSTQEAIRVETPKPCLTT